MLWQRELDRTGSGVYSRDTCRFISGVADIQFLLPQLVSGILHVASLYLIKFKPISVLPYYVNAQALMPL